MKLKLQKVPPSALYFETDRLIIRPFERKDIAPSYTINLDPDVTRYTGDGGVVDLQEMERRIVTDVFGDYGKYGFGRLAVEWKSNREFIGFTGLKYIPDWEEVDLGYRFKQAYWGKGIATESGKAVLDFAWHQLGLKRVIATVLPGNQRSIRVLEKLGFSYEKEMMEDQEKIKWYGNHLPRV